MNRNATPSQDKHIPRDANYQRLNALLRSIYADKLTDDFTDRLQALISSVRIPTRDFIADETDVVIIAFADHIRKSGEPSLAVLHDFCNRYFDGLANTLHILPHYPSNGDRGFSVSDYMTVDPAFGDWGDVREMSGDFSLMLDAVINHTSSEHAWFTGFLAGDKSYRDYIWNCQQIRICR